MFLLACGVSAGSAESSWLFALREIYGERGYLLHFRSIPGPPPDDAHDDEPYHYYDGADDTDADDDDDNDDDDDDDDYCGWQ